MIKFAIDIHNTLRVSPAFPDGLTESTALNHALRKWEFLVTETARRCGEPSEQGEVLNDGGVTTCGLCAKYYKRYSYPICAGCPVALKTGLTGCAGTPYNHFSGAINLDEQRAAAPKMLAFLKELKRPTVSPKRPIKRPPRKIKQGNTTPPIRIRYGTSPALHLHQRGSAT